MALTARDPQAVAARLSAGDSAQDLNHLGIPALYDGLRSNHATVLKLLDAAGADWSTPYNEGGFTPLIYASLHCELATVRWLVERGQAVDQRTAQGVGVMHVSVQRNSPEIARYLYERGADAFAETVHGETPLLISLKAKHGLGLFEFMLQCYADNGVSMAPRLLPCLGCVFEKQQPDAVEAVKALLPFAETVPAEADLRAYMAQPGNYASTPFRTLETTLNSRLSRTLFALLKAERVARASGGSASPAPVWRGFGGL